MLGGKTEPPASGKPPEPDKELTTEQIVARDKPSVALVKHRLGSGTGFLVADQILMTNAHVVRGDFVENLRVSFPSAGEKDRAARPVELLYQDDQRDLAILKVATSLPPLTVADDCPCKGGEKIIFIGCPGANAGEEVLLENAVTQGVMSTRTTLNGLSFYQLGANVNHGNSGGPLLDARGQVIGVITRKAVGKQQEGMGFAIPLEDVRSAIEKCTRQTPQDAAQVKSQHELFEVHSHLVLLGLVHGRAMELLSEGMDEAVKAGKPPLEGWNEAMKVVEQDLKLKGVKGFFHDGLRVALTHTLSDSTVPQATRDKLGQLNETYNNMRSAIAKPESDDAFRRKKDSLIAEFNEEIEALKDLLGVEALHEAIGTLEELDVSLR
jgi:S1-C subfamily serine protease